MHNKNILPKEFKAPHTLSGLPKNSPILVGFSGGADSSALLLMLKSYSEQSGAKIYAAHLNHGIRGEEANRDERFCREFAQSLDIEFFSLNLDIPKLAKESGESIESAARRARYNFFNTIMIEKSIPILATAHNADDNLETMIFNLSRGTGLSGLCGIPNSRPTDCGVVIRPILTMEKKDIIAFCNKHKINYVTDSTNADNDYTRNKIRNQIIPLLKEINSNVTQNASRAAETLKEDSFCLQNIAECFIKENCEDYSISLKQYCKTSPSIANRVLIDIYGKISCGKTLEATHIKSINELAQKGIPHSSISLPAQINAIIEDEKLCFIHNSEKKHTDNFNIELKNGKNILENANIEIFINFDSYSKNIYKKSILLSLESDKIKGVLKARNRQSGDKILSGGIHKSVKKLMNEKKIPIELRERIPIIYDDNGILAIPFVAIRDEIKSTKQTLENNQIKITVCIR